jgi:hypothetical protein
MSRWARNAKVIPKMSREEYWYFGARHRDTIIRTGSFKRSGLSIVWINENQMKSNSVGTVTIFRKNHVLNIL